MLTNFYSIWPTVYRVNLQHSNYSYTRLTCIPLLHYLGETSQLYSNSFSNQSYTLPLHKLKVGLSIHTVGLYLSLKITASGQNVIFHLHRLGVYYVIQQVHKALQRASIKRCLWSSNCRQMHSIRHDHTPYSMVSWVKIGAIRNYK